MLSLSQITYLAHISIYGKLQMMTSWTLSKFLTGIILILKHKRTYSIPQGKSQTNYQQRHLDGANLPIVVQCKPINTKSLGEKPLNTACKMDRVLNGHMQKQPIV